MDTITPSSIDAFIDMLIEGEKAPATCHKYLRAVQQLADWLDGADLTKKRLLEYRDHLLQKKSPQTVNGELSAIHAYLDFRGLGARKVRFLKVQRRAFLEESRELTEAEYRKLLQAAKNKGNERLYLLMMTLCSTGIRVSELPFITLEAAQRGRSEIRMKGKCRTILLPGSLCKKLISYARRKGIRSGHIFRTRSGLPLDRTNIGHDMKNLCTDANVNPQKVFPHNLRHLFARCFIAIEKNIAHLADILGHSRIETTRIYVATSAQTHSRILNQMRLVI